LSWVNDLFLVVPVPPAGRFEIPKVEHAFAAPRKRVSTSLLSCQASILASRCGVFERL
jgi:hypothetical protein